MEEPQNTVHHDSGKLNEDGLSEEWMTVWAFAMFVSAKLMESHSLRVNLGFGPRSTSTVLLQRIEKRWRTVAR
jgi:hypothetical protein